MTWICANNKCHSKTEVERWTSATTKWMKSKSVLGRSGAFEVIVIIYKLFFLDVIVTTLYIFFINLKKKSFSLHFLFTSGKMIKITIKLFCDSFDVTDDDDDCDCDSWLYFHTHSYNDDGDDIFIIFFLFEILFFIFLYKKGYII